MTTLLEQRLVSPERAAELLKLGGLVVVPTETVYGLGVDARQSDALARMYFLKGRPVTHPVIVHLAHSDQLEEWAKTIPDYAWTLARHFWPGPMTLILKKQPNVLDAVTGGQDTIGLRIPSHPDAQKILSLFQGGMAAPSANRFGKLSPTRVGDLDPVILDEIDGVVEGGPCPVGIESTIIDCSGLAPRILRPGMMPPELIAQVLNQEFDQALNDSNSPNPRVSGSLASHYAPETPIEMLILDHLVDEACQAVLKNRQVAVLGYSEGLKEALSPLALTGELFLPATPEGYAQGVYAALFELDRLRAAVILVERPPEGDLWQGIVDRLTRAARGAGRGNIVESDIVAGTGS